MKFEMIIRDDLFTFKPLDDAAVAWMRKSTYANGGLPSALRSSTSETACLRQYRRPEG